MLADVRMDGPWEFAWVEAERPAAGPWQWTYPDDRVRAVAVAADGLPVFATASERGLLRVWDLTTGMQIGKDCADDGGSGRIAVAGSPDGGLVVASGSGNEGTVRLWNPLTGGQVGDVVTDAGWAPAIAAAVVHGRPVLVAGRLDDTVRVWDFAGGGELANLVDCEPPFGGPVLALGATTVRESAFVAAVIGDVDDAAGPVRVWNLTTGQQVGAAFAADTEPHSVALVFVDGQPVVVTAGWDKAVRLWDPASGEQVGAPLTEWGGSRMVATGRLAGRPVAVAGGRSEGRDVVRVWDLADHRQIGADLVFPQPIEAVAASDDVLGIAFGAELAVLIHHP